MEEDGRGPSYLVYEFERRAYPLSDTGFTIGRDAGSNIVVREPAVSRSHAELRAEGAQYVLHASGPTGTRVNGTAVTGPVSLEEGDRIEIGSAVLTFRQGRLPLGVSVVDTASAGGHDPDAMTKRETIANPILGAAAEPEKRKSTSPMLILFVLMVIVAAYFLATR